MHKSALLAMLSLPPTVDPRRRAQFSLSRRPCRHEVRAALAIPLLIATVFLGRAAAEQRSIFRTAAAELRATYQNITKKKRL